MFCGERVLMFSTSAREGGTDTKRQGRSAPHQEGRSHELTPLPTDSVRTHSGRQSELEEGPDRVLEWEPPQRSKRDTLRPLQERVTELTPKHGRGYV